MHIEECFYRGTVPLSKRININTAETTGMRYLNVNLMTESRNGGDYTAASVKLKTINDSPYSTAFAPWSNL